MRESKLEMNTILLGDALQILKTLPDNHVDAIVTDPPAGISFMGLEFDHNKGGRTQWVAWLSEIMAEALRCLKPGGHALVWALPKTSHWTACALEDAGFEIKNKLYHIFASGFPKSLNISKELDRIAGVERTGGAREWSGGQRSHGILGNNHGTQSRIIYDAAVTSEAQMWDGWGTALKPAVEEWILCRKPLAESSVARNVLVWGTGGINIDASRIPHVTVAGGNLAQNTHLRETVHARETSLFNTNGNTYTPPSQGRWPSHLLISHAEDCQPGACVPGCPALELDKQSGVRKSGALKPYATATGNFGSGYASGMRNVEWEASEGGASRFFTQFYYAPKASKKERNRGCEGLPASRVARMGHGNDEPDERTQSFISQPQANIHPTVKNQQLMRWLCKLITPPNGIVLDCFAGSGSTGVAAITESFRFIGIELDPGYAAIATARLTYALAEAEAQREKQLTLFEHPHLEQSS